MCMEDIRLGRRTFVTTRVIGPDGDGFFTIPANAARVAMALFPNNDLARCILCTQKSANNFVTRFGSAPGIDGAAASITMPVVNNLFRVEDWGQLVTAQTFVIDQSAGMAALVLHEFQLSEE